MSEKKRREEAAARKRYLDAEIERLREAHWWNTSAGLSGKCIGVEASPQWEAFAKEYDEPKNQDHRLREWHKSRTWRGFSVGLHHLQDLAEEATEGNPQAGSELAYKVLELIEGEKAYRDFTEGVKLRRKPASGVSEATWALKQFCERHKRLPSRKELNRECYILGNLKHRTVPLKLWLGSHSKSAEFEFGDRLSETPDQRIYWMNFDYPNEVRLQTYEDPEGSIKKLRWDLTSSTYSEILKKTGLRALE